MVHTGLQGFNTDALIALIYVVCLCACTCCRRGSDNNAPAERLVNQLLTEMDGIDGRVVSVLSCGARAAFFVRHCSKHQGYSRYHVFCALRVVRKP